MVGFESFYRISSSYLLKKPSQKLIFTLLTNKFLIFTFKSLYRQNKMFSFEVKKRSKIWQQRIVLKNNLIVWPTQTDWLYHLLSFSSSFLCGMVLFVVVMSKAQGKVVMKGMQCIKIFENWDILKLFPDFEYIGIFVVTCFSSWKSYTKIDCCIL